MILSSPVTRVFRAIAITLVCLGGALTPFASNANTPPQDFPLVTSAALQARLETMLDDMGLSEAADSGRLAVSLVTLDGKQVTAMAGVNDHAMMYAASLPKIAILFGAAVAIDRGRLAPDQALKKDIRQMIARSCNPCATRVLAAIGRDWLVELLRDEAYRLYDPEVGGGLWVGKDYAPAPAYLRDPLAGLSHGATTWQAARFYWLLLNGRLASPEQTQMMIDALAEPRINHKFVKGLSPLTQLRLWRKSGSWRSYHADSALVLDGNQPRCIMVVMARDARASKWLEQLAPALYSLATTAESPATPDG